MKNTSFFSLLIVLLFSLFAIVPLFSSGFFTMHDDTQVARVYEMGKALHDGIFPVRWVADLGYGYGYPIFNFYAPLAYYIGAIPFLLGINALVATKIMFGFGILLSGAAMYFCGKSFGGKWAGIIAGILYMYAPYHAVNIYVRGAVGEFFAYAFVPLVFYGIWEYTKEKRLSAIVIGALGMAGVILSHNLTAFMLTPFVGLCILFCLFVFFKKNNKQGSLLFLIPILGVTLSAFYWLPVLFEMKYTNVESVLGGGSDIRDHFVCFTQLWNSPWGFGGSAPGCIDGMSFRIGKIHIILFGMSSIVLLLKKRKEGMFLISSTLLSLFFLLPLSQFVWETFSPMEFFQFPWRFLLLVSFFISLIGGIGLALMIEEYLKVKQILVYGLLSIFCLGVTLYYGKLFVPQTVTNKTADDYTNQQYLLWDTSKISDEYMPKNFQKPKNSSEVVREKLTISDYPSLSSGKIKTGRQEYLFPLPEADMPRTLHFATAYFPSWKLYVNNELKEYTVVPKGLAYTLNTAGTYKVELVFEQTIVEKIGNGISLIGVFVLLSAIIKGRRYEKNTRDNNARL